MVIRINAWLSSFAVNVVNNSEQSIAQHKAIGFADNSIFIGNGFDLNAFKPSLGFISTVSTGTQLAIKYKIIGNIGRYHPVKNHIGVLRVFHHVIKQSHSPLCLFMAGKGVDDNEVLQQEVERLGLARYCILLGSSSSEMLMPAFDLYLSVSLSEGFPNVIGEAMACVCPVLPRMWETAEKLLLSMAPLPQSMIISS